MNNTLGQTRSFVISSPRLLLVGAVMLYVAIFNVTYRDLVTPVFSFWGMGYRDIPQEYYWTTVVLCVLPALWMPLRFTRASLLIFYMQYLLIYVPGSFLVFHSTRPELPFDFAMQIVWWMFAGISIMQGVYLFPTRGSAFLRLTPGAFWVLFCAIASVMLLYLVVTLSRNFHLVGFKDVNNVRFAMADLLAATGTRFGAYSQFLLLATFLPVLFAVGAYGRKWWLIGLVGCTYIFIFGIDGAKQAALAIVYLPMTYFLLAQSKEKIPLLFIVGLSMALLSGYVSRWVLSPVQDVSYRAVLHFRLFGIPAFNMPQYAGFFHDHPVTHLSHVTGISMLLRYPYESDIAYTIGWYYYHQYIGANAGLWATDGVAAFGLWGIPLISVLCAAVFWVLDTITEDMDPSYVGITLSYSAVSFTNVSLFTTLITGGLAFLIMVYALAPRALNGRIELPSVPFRGGVRTQRAQDLTIP